MPIREIRRIVFKLAWAYVKAGEMPFPDALRHAWSIVRTTYTANVVATTEQQAALAAIAGARVKVELRSDRIGVTVWLVTRKVAVHAGWLTADDSAQVQQVWSQGGRVVATAQLTGMEVALTISHYRIGADRCAA